MHPGTNIYWQLFKKKREIIKKKKKNKIYQIVAIHHKFPLGNTRRFIMTRMLALLYTVAVYLNFTDYYYYRSTRFLVTTSPNLGMGGKMWKSNTE
jgi:hypothetical protein